MKMILIVVETCLKFNYFVLENLLSLDFPLLGSASHSGFPLHGPRMIPMSRDTIYVTSHSYQE